MDLNPPKPDVGEENRTTNLAGGEAYDPSSPELGLYKVVVNNLLENTYYESDKDSLEKVKERFELVARSNPEFPLQLAAYAREELYLRDISQVLLVLSDNYPFDGDADQDEVPKDFIEEYAQDIMQRADEPARVVAFAKDVMGESLSRPLKRAIGDVLHNFDTYQFSKYDSSRRAVNLRDVLNLVHARPRDEEHEEIFERVIRGHLDDYGDVDPLDPPETWEVIVSSMGSTQEAWETALPRMGMFARLRNVRNMLEVGISADDIIETPMMYDDYETGELKTLSEDGMTMEEVQRRKLFPFRFYQSYKALQRAGISDPVITDWVEDAIEASLPSIPEEVHNTFTAVDLSGSMNKPVASRSTLKRSEIAAFFGAVLMRHGSDVGAFGKKFLPVRAHYDTPTLQLVDTITNTYVGHSTNGHLALQYLREERLTPDRVIMFTDEQLWDSYGSGDSLRQELETYRSWVDPHLTLYVVDLASYGTLSIPEDTEGVFNVSGWTDNIIDFILHAESPDETIDEIRNYPPE